MFIDPGGWAQHAGEAIAAAMMSARKTEEKGNYGASGDDFPYRRDDVSMLAALRRWVHPSVTVAIAIFAFGQYEAAQRWRADTDTKIAVIQEKLEEAKNANLAQDTVTHLAVSALTNRLDLQREEIRTMRQQIADHYSNDDRRFGRGNVR